MTTVKPGLIAVLLFVPGLNGLASEPVRIVSPQAVANPRQPQAAVDAKGTIYVAFGAHGSVYCTTSTDGGNRFTDPVSLGKVEKLALGHRRGPRIAVTGVAVVVAVVVTAISHDDGSLVAWRSSDQGRTWKGPVTINDNSPRTANEGLHAMAAAPKGDVYCVWLDHRIDDENQIFGSRSTDGGKTWSKNRLIYRSPSGSVCPCCHPSATYDSQGILYVMWRNEVNGYRDLWSTSSKDGGETFGPAAKIGAGSWKLDACPMDGGYLAATAPGKLTTVWLRQKQVYRTETGTQKEKPLGQGEQPWVAGTSAGAYIVWISRDHGDLWLMTPDAKNPKKLASHAIDPMIGASTTGRGPVVAVWETGQHRNTSLRAVVVRE